MKMKRLIVIPALLLLILNIITVPARAYNGYRVTVSAGLHGTFDSSITDTLIASGIAAEDISVIDERTVEVTLYKNGDSDPEWNPSYFMPQIEDDRYYFKGYHVSGIEGVTAGAQTIKEDTVFVAAYGVKGDLVAYHVHYVDNNGNTLLETADFHGNVGDKPVAAYIHIEGYVPQARNITGTLKEDDSENNFTFVYTKASPIIIYEEGETVYIHGGTGGGGASQGEQGEEVPEPVDIIDIDDDTTPTTQPDDTDKEPVPDAPEVPESSFLKTYGLPIGIGLLLILAILFFILFGKKRKDE